ncbi:hypothetical protein A8990_110140 [Paenibacillus taihuensis]|uniref:Uncharacterized protein n=1 Tax=Paenibacillus taihuensis TaxID=1156355 RepID=A0A3D9S1P8_9BACL|nr:hypothetical protein [Paenibacillus taihuensis]REE86530.1 hypothetical protein A8990_110140 [Paenibacillus taihuensis]
MLKLRANLAFYEPPKWALLERQLITLMNEAVEPLIERYIRPDGTMLWPTTDNHTGIDALDDMYESFFNWPLYYVLGGHEKFKELSKKEFDAITVQFARYDSGTGHKMVEKEYEQGYDWFHQGEGYTMFYHMGLMDPSDATIRERAMKYAGLFLNEDPEVINYDEEHHMIPYPHSGSMGATDRNFKVHFSGWHYADWMRNYGLHFQDVPGVGSFEDLKHEAGAMAMGQAIVERCSQGDIPLNLLATSMVTNAYLHTGDTKYKKWVKSYVDAWIERTQRNGGLIPDNVGLNGEIGEHNGGKWYGGWYGWTWPHGWLSVGQGVGVAAQNALLLERDPAYAEFLRSQLTIMNEKAIVQDGTRYVPYKFGEPGWYGYHTKSVLLEDDGKTVLWKDGAFEFMPIEPVYPTHLWYMSMEETDHELLKSLRNYAKPDWNHIEYYRNKDQAGHDYAWTSYLAGEFEDYPEQILNYNMAQVYHRINFMRTDAEDPARYKDDYFQIRNTVTLEGLLQLTLGAPSPLYNGGLLMARLRYFDADARRPGLPADVAALVEKVEADRTVVKLVNLHPTQRRSLVVQAGAFGEHQFTDVAYTVFGATADDGSQLGAATTLEKLPDGLYNSKASQESAVVNDKWLLVELEPGCHTTLELGTKRYVNEPSYQEPWEALKK